METLDLRAKRWTFIVNPVAGAGYAAAYEPEARREAAARGLDASFVLTEGKGHASELAEKAAKRGDGVVAVIGGDGTLSEAASTLAGTGTVLAPISAGTGNDFVSITGFSQHFRAQDWDALLKGSIARMDLGTCNGKRFINGIGFGFDAEVAAANYGEDGAVKQGGKNKYIWHILKTLVGYTESSARYSVDGKDFDGLSFLNTVAVGRRMAGGLHLTPDAIADDGYLDFCRIDRLSLLERLRYLVAVIKKNHGSLAKTHFSLIESLRVDFGREAPYHVDGEVFFAKTLHVGIEKGALLIAIDPARPNAFSN